MTKKVCLIYFDLTEDATLKDIQKAFRKKAKELHPDVNHHDTTKEFQKANQYYQFLKNSIQNQNQENSFNFSFDEFENMRSAWENNDFSSLDVLNEDGYNMLGVKIGNIKLNPKTIIKYKTNLSKRTCTCKYFIGKREKFAKTYDYRRLCRHLILSIERKKNQKLLGIKNEKILLNYDFEKLVTSQIYLNLPKDLQPFHQMIENLYGWTADTSEYFTSNGYYNGKHVIIYHYNKIKISDTATIYLKKSYQLSMLMQFNFGYPNRLEIDGYFLHFCTEEAFNEIISYFCSNSSWNQCLNDFKMRYQNYYYKKGRLIQKKADTNTYQSEKDAYVLKDDYYDNLYSESYNYNIYNCEENSNAIEMKDIKDIKLNEFKILTYFLNLQKYSIKTKEFNKAMLDMGIIKHETSLNNGKSILSSEYLAYGMNIENNSKNLQVEIPEWYKIHYFHPVDLKFCIYSETKHLPMTTLLFKVESFDALYDKVNKYISENKQNNIKQPSTKQLEREKWLRHVSCPNCGEQTNIHKKDKRKRKAGYIQRFYCNECNSMFQMNLGKLDKMIQEHEVNEVEKEIIIDLEETKDIEIVQNLDIDKSSYVEEKKHIFKKLFPFLK